MRPLFVLAAASAAVVSSASESPSASSMGLEDASSTSYNYSIRRRSSSTMNAKQPMPRQAQMLTLSDEGASLSMEPFSMTLSPLNAQQDVLDNPDAQFAITAGTDSFLTQELKSINPNVTSVITEIVSISDAPISTRSRNLQDSSSTVVQLGGTVHVDSEPVPTSNQLNTMLNEALADTTFLVRNITSVGVPALSDLEEIGVTPLEIADTPSPTTTPTTAAPTTGTQDKVIAGANQDLSSSNQDEKSTLEMVYPAIIVAVAVFVLTALVIVVRRNRSAKQEMMAKDAAASTSDSEAADIDVDPHQQLMEDGQTMIHMPAQYQIQGATTKQNNNDPEYDPRDRSMVPPMILRMASSLEDDASYADQSAFHQYPARTPTPTTHHFNDGNYDEFRET